LQQFFPFLEKYYLQLKTGDFSAMHEIYEAKLYRLNEMKTFKTADETFEGITRGIDQDGRLIIEENGKLRYSTSAFIV
jgi:BirA family biotin operon repressor/biotin-[acetyl-CoA-carboxylase] ligase